MLLVFGENPIVFFQEEKFMGRAGDRKGLAGHERSPASMLPKEKQEALI
jgi:hypothetical protein